MFIRQPASFWIRKKIVILGAGKSGLASAVFLKARGNDVTLSEKGGLSEAVKNELESHDIPYEEQGHQESTLMQADLMVASPGIPLTAQPYQWASQYRIPVISEIELASQFTSARMIAITGSNGKTTTSSLCYELLQQAGLNVGCGGNIGTPMISLVEQGHDYLILEISSFQLETTYSFHPWVGMLLNLYNNHLDRHQTMENYFAIKSRLFQNQTGDDWAILNRGNEWSHALGKKLPSRLCHFSLQPPADVFHHDRTLWWHGHGMGPEPLLPTRDLPLKGAHNLENYLAMIALAQIMEIDEDTIQRTVEQVKGIPHRLEWVRTLQQRTFYNDSKATNYLATMKAIESLDGPLILIAGGQDKGGDMAELCRLIQTKVRQVFLMGVDAPRLQAELVANHYHNSYIVESLEAAVLAAYQHSQAQDQILLSPACASYDMFRNFEERGERFKQYVHSLTD